MRVSLHRSISVVVAVAACALVLAGCARDAAEPAESPSPASTSTPTPTPTPTAEHTIAFGGDCDAVLRPDQRRALFDVETVGYGADPGTDVGVGTLGGVDCGWHAVDGKPVAGDAYRASVLVFPTSVIPTDLQTEASEGHCIQMYDASTCTLGADVDGVWVVAQTVHDARADLEAPTAFLQSVIDAVAANMAGAVRPVASTPTAGWWKVDVSCEELGRRLGLADFLGSAYITGWWEGNPSLQWTWRLLESAGVSRTCLWFPDFDDESSNGASYGLTSLELSPGGAWDAERTLGVGEAATLAGGQLAAVDGRTALTVDGPNVARVDVGASGTGDPTSILERAVRELATNP